MKMEGESKCECKMFTRLFGTCRTYRTLVKMADFFISVPEAVVR